MSRIGRRGRDDMQLKCNSVWKETGHRPGGSREAIREEEMDGGRILIISHSQRGS